MKGEKICFIDDPEQLRPYVMESGDYSCAKCCARSKDAEDLCEPVSSSNTNLFCE